MLSKLDPCGGDQLDYSGRHRDALPRRHVRPCFKPAGIGAVNAIMVALGQIWRRDNVALAS
jgi:hypothetical protein